MQKYCLFLNHLLSSIFHISILISAAVKRYIKRGSDSFGDVANFVETEQILHRMDGQATSSFVQVSRYQWCFPLQVYNVVYVLNTSSFQPIIDVAFEVGRAFVAAVLLHF